MMNIREQIAWEEQELWRESQRKKELGMYVNNEKFFYCFEKVVGFEGGYVNDSVDRGGETKYGISKRAFPYLDIANLTLDDAQAIYYKKYYASAFMNLEKIEDKDLCLELFESAVLMGVKTVAQNLQKALNYMNDNGRLYDDLRVDGWIGEKSFKALKKVNPKLVIKVLNGLQFNRLVKIVERNKEQERFFKGWLKRV